MPRLNNTHRLPKVHYRPVANPLPYCQKRHPSRYSTTTRRYNLIGTPIIAQVTCINCLTLMRDDCLIHQPATE